MKELFSPSKNNLLELFDHGYQDAKKHKEYLDMLFDPRISEKEDNSHIIDI